VSRRARSRETVELELRAVSAKLPGRSLSEEREIWLRIDTLLDELAAYLT